MPLKFVSAVNQSDETIEFGAMTVLVGPNNSGKSQTLRDFALGNPEEALTLFRTITVTMPPAEDFDSYFEVLPLTDSPSNETVIGIDETRRNGQRVRA